MEIHPTKDEPRAAVDDGRRAAVAKQPKLDFNHGQQATSSKDLM